MFNNKHSNIFEENSFQIQLATIFKTSLKVMRVLANSGKGNASQNKCSTHVATPLFVEYGAYACLFIAVASKVTSAEAPQNRRFNLIVGTSDPKTDH